MNVWGKQTMKQHKQEHLSVSLRFWILIFSNVIWQSVKQALNKCRTYFRVTIVKDKDTHKSKGVAFVLFLERESAHNCARAVNNKQVSLCYWDWFSNSVFHWAKAKVLMSWCLFEGLLLLCLSPSCLAERWKQVLPSIMDEQLSL